jgi:dTDP-4-amino-4,6-dideoxygalactose transaminase
VQAAILRVLLKNLDKNNDKRRYLAGIYNKELSSITSLELPKLREGAEHVYHLFVINTDQRDKLKEYLASNDISSLIHYPIPIHKQKCFSEFKSVKLPITESASKRVLSLPCHPYLEKKDILYVCQKIKTFFQNDKKI